MFGMGTTRENVKKINRIVNDTGLEQLKLNIFILMRDIVFLSENGGYIKDIDMRNPIEYREYTEEEINNLFYKYSSSYSTDFIKELITPEITESRFVSKEQLEFLRDVYSTDGSQLKSFHDLKKKYGKNFDDIHKNLIFTLRNLFSYKNDLLYLEKYLNSYLSDYEEKHDYHSLFSRILYYDDRERESYKETGLLRYEELLYPTVKEAVDIIFNDNIDDITDEEKKDIATSIKEHKNELLLFFLCREFILNDIYPKIGKVWDLPVSLIYELPKGEYISNYVKSNDIYLYPNDIIVNNRLSVILKNDLSEFVQSINKEYEINFTPTDEMISEFNKFKNYYNHCKLLEQKNNLLYDKYKKTNENKIDLIYEQERPLTEKDVKLYDFCIECNNLVGDAMGDLKRRR